MTKPTITLDLGSPEWAAYENLKALAHKLRQDPMIGDPHLPASAGFNFTCHQLTNTSLMNVCDVHNLIHRSIGGLAMLLFQAGLIEDHDVRDHLAYRANWTIDQLYTIVLDLSQQIIKQALDEMQNATTNITSPKE